MGQSRGSSRGQGPSGTSRGGGMANRGGGRGRQRDSEFQDRVVEIRRVAKVVKGGRRFNFSALVVVGDGKGRVGTGLGKANTVPAAIQKGQERAKRDMFDVPLRNTTIPHEVLGTTTSVNLVQSTVEGLKQLRTKADIEQLRGVKITL